MFDFEQLEQVPFVQSVDPTPDDGDITDIDWMQIGLDCLLIPALFGMAIPVMARLSFVSPIPVAGLGGLVIPGLSAMIFLDNPKNRFKWIFTLLAYTAGLFGGSWDWIQAIAVADTLIGIGVIAIAAIVAFSVCWVIKGAVRNG